MGFPHRHWSPIQRRYPASVQVANTHFMTFWADGLRQHTFRNFHCSFLFEGNADLRVDRREYHLSAPCAFIIYPRETVDICITDTANGWKQLYFDFDARYVAELERIRLVHRSRRTWLLNNPGNLWVLSEELATLSHQFPLEQAVDRVDRLCEQVIIESQTAPHDVVEDDLIERVLQKMRREPRQPFNLMETVRLARMSEATFRRRWDAKVGVSPRRYLERLRIQTACRLLIETDLPVNEIARKVGFDDEFYFSRRFSAMWNLSPRAYRKQHKMA
ncbi:MAG TPA: AraC family transcriptional regulator [Chthoniobacteraceae bacterium]|nr:AraC family transcriptional regulator [Chthoniobacteraceae bacterium]